MACRGSCARRAAALVLATLLIIVPLGVLHHLLDHHLGGGTRSVSGLHRPGDPNGTAAQTTDSGHRHVWVIVAAAAPGAVLCAPSPVGGVSRLRGRDRSKSAAAADVLAAPRLIAPS